MTDRRDGRGRGKPPRIDRRTKRAGSAPRPAAPPTVREGISGPDIAIVSARAATRLAQGHPWVFRSDVVERPTVAAGCVRVRTPEGRPLGHALWSPQSEISLRWIDVDAARPTDAQWWHTMIGRAIGRRERLRSQASALRLVHGEADGLPSLVVDQYDRWLVVQLLSAGLEAHRAAIVAALRAHV